MAAKHRILAVSDDPTTRVLLQRTLEHVGYEVQTAETARMARDLLAPCSPDLIVVESVLSADPQENPCGELFRVAQQTAVPTILVTSGNEPAQVVAALSAGACDYSPKPFTTQELLARIGVHLRARQAEAEVRSKQRELESLQSHLSNLSRKDSLTQLLSRSAFDEVVIEAFSRLQRYERPYAVIIVDLDRFRSYNETYGRQSGDECLQKVARAIAEVCRNGDYLGRYGGDQFAILCPETDAHKATHLAERLRRAVWGQAIHNPAGTGARLTASLGVACGQSTSWELVLQRAEAAVQLSKRAGRNMVHMDRSLAGAGDNTAVEHLPPSATPGPPPLDLLVVDDDPTNRVICKHLLQQAGYHVREAEDGRIALARVKECVPDVILMDVMMPNMDGLECTRALRADPDTKEVPIIIISAMSRTEDILSGLEAGADEYLSKPIRGSELAVRVKSMARLHRERNDLLQSYAERGKQMQILTRLVHFCRGVSKSKSINDILNETVSAVAEVMGCRRVSIMLPDERQEHLRIANSFGIDSNVARSIILPVGEAVAGRVFTSGEPTVINTEVQARSLCGDYSSPYFASVPIISAPLDGGGRVVGVLNATERIHGEPFGGRDLEYIELISKVSGTAIDDLNMREARDQASDSIMVAMASLAECRDSDTGRHLERVTLFCRMLAETLREEETYRQVIDDGFLHNLERAVPLHDIGKVAISDEILLFPGKLTDEQMAIMRTHAEVGANTIQALMDRAPDVPFLEMAMDIARSHHERWDGNGYPQGLSGEEIPLSARITSVADVYDALTTARPYKEPYSHDVAVEIIQAGRETQFDPAVVDAFMQREEAFATLAASMVDQANESQAPELLAAAAC